MSLHSRLKRLEKLSAVVTCPACAARRITEHQEYELPNGETITLPPIPDAPPCTCGNRERNISVVVFSRPGQVASREEAERRYAEYAAANRPWQSVGAGRN